MVVSRRMCGDGFAKRLGDSKELMDIAEVQGRLATELEDFGNSPMRQWLSEYLVPVRQTTLFWGWTEPHHDYSAWIIADLQTRNVGIVYAEGGFADRGCPWGLIFLDQDNTGADYSWYRTLEECVLDSGYCEPQAPT